MDDKTAEVFYTKRKKIKKWWEQLSNLERNLATSLVIAAAVLLLLLLILIIQAATSPQICKTSNCLLAASEIVSRTDPTINPCNDFYQFTCRKLNELNNKKIQLTVEQVEDQLIDILMSPSVVDEHAQLKSQKNLFKMCLNKSEGDVSFEKLKKILDELHGWPVVLGYDWRAGSFEWKTMVRQLREKGLPYGMMLSLVIAPSPDSNHKFVLHIRKPKVKKVHQEYRHEYRKLMTEVAIAFGSERSRAINDMKRVLDFMIEFQKLTEKYHQTEKQKLFEIQTYFNEIDWSDFVNGILEPTAAISQDDYVMAPGRKFMQEFFALINRTPKRIQANYIMWTIIEEYLPFLTDKLRTLQSNYAHFIGSVSLSPERWHLQQCNNIVSNSFLLPPSEVAYAKMHLGTEKVSQIEQLAQDLKTVFEMFLKDTVWINPESQTKALAKIKSLTIIANVYFEDEAESTSGDNGNFLSTYLGNMKKKVNAVYTRLYKDQSDPHYFFRPIYTTDVMYLSQSNSLVLPVGSYYEDTPVYLNYGEMGAIISQKLTRAIIAEEESLWTRNYNESCKCVLQEESDAVARDFIGVQLSYAAYQLWMHHHGREEQLIGLKYTPNQLSWISSVLGYCTFLNGKTSKLINGVLRNHPNFADDFQCPWGSPMNPLKKCKII